MPFNLSRTTTLSDWPAIATDGTDRVYVAWVEGEVGDRDIFYSTYYSGLWSPPINVSVSPGLDSNTPDIAADASGGANVVWQEGWYGDSDIEVRYARCVGAFCGTPAELSNGRCSRWPGDWNAWTPAITYGQDGKILVTWASFEPGANYFPSVTWTPPDPAPTQITRCMPFAGVYWMPDLAPGQGSERRLVLEEFSVSTVRHALYRLGSWGSLRTVASGAIPDVVVDQAGTSHIAWCYLGAVRYAFGDGLGPWSPVEDISVDQQCGRPPAVALRHDGVPQVVWEGRAHGVQVLQSYRSNTGWSPPEDISQSPANGENPGLAADSEGVLHLVWADSREGNFEILYSRLVTTLLPMPMGLRPSQWTMVLSLRPTLRWDSIPDAFLYKIRLFRSTADQGLGPQLMELAVAAENSSDPQDPSTHFIRLDEDLTTGLSLSTAGYLWSVVALDGDGDTLALSELASFQIPPLGGSWDQVRPQLCFPRVIDGKPLAPAQCLYRNGEKPNPYWNRYDALIYQWAEYWDIPPALLKAIYVGETSSALGPRRIGSRDFEPTRAYLYEPYVDWSSFVNSGTPCSIRTSYASFCLPDHPPTEVFEGLGGFPFPYDRQVDAGTSIYDYAFLSTLGGPFSDLGQWGLSRIPGCLPTEDPRHCPANAHPAQYRVAASFGLGQIVYKGIAAYLEPFRDDIRPEDPPSRVPPEAFYDPGFNVNFSAFHLGQKRSIYGVCPELRADSDLSLWSVPVLDFNGGGNEDYDETVIARGTYDTSPRSLVAGVTEIQYELQPHTCNSVSSSSRSRGPALLVTETQGTEVAGRFVDLRGDGTPVWVSLVAFDTVNPGAWEGEVHIYVNASREELLWRSPRISNVNPDGAVRESPALARPLALADWSAGVHAQRTYPLIWDGTDFLLLPTYDESGTPTDGLGSDGGGVYPFPDGSLIAFHQTYSNTAGERLATVFAFDPSGYRPARRFVYDSAAEDLAPPDSTVSIEPAPNEAGWVKGPAKVALAAVDDQAVESITYSLEGPNPQPAITAPLDKVSFLVSEGVWVLQWRATDMSLNASLDQSIVLHLDSTPPVVQALLEGERSESGWFRSKVLVTLQAQDPPLAGGEPGSGIASLEYSLDGGLTWTGFEAPFVIDHEGATLLLYRSLDVAGNASEEMRLEVLIDRAPPTGEVFAEPTQLWPPNGKLVPVHLLGQAFDAESGLRQIALSVIDEYGQWQPSLAAIDLSGENSTTWQRVLDLLASRRGTDRNGRQYVIEVVIYDAAGNGAQIQTFVVVPHDQR